MAAFGVAGVLTPATAQAQVKTFPDLKFMELVKDLDPKNAYDPMGEKDLWGGGSFSKNPDAKATMAYWIARNNAGDVEKPATYKSGIFNHQVWTNSAGVPMVRYSITEGRQHNFAVTETWMLWDEFLCKFSRNANGEIEYMKDPNVMR